MKKIETGPLRTELSERVDYFVCSASFEERSLTIAKHVKSFANTDTIVFFTSSGGRTTANRDELLEMAGNRAKSVKLFQDAPIQTADAISGAMSALIGQKGGRLIVDITCFTHEQLLILMRYLQLSFEGKVTAVSIFVAYSGAKEYSHNTSVEEMWLSRGIREVRPVLGFSGRFNISKPVQLIILVGFEHERAKAAIEFVEPGYLVLGRGKVAESVSPELATTNASFHVKLERFVGKMAAMFSSYTSFEFSGVNSEDTCNDILAVADTENRNVIVCPMNTKLSTIGASLAVVRDSRIQLMYVEPLEYNEEGYSVPGPHLRFGELAWASQS